MNRFFSIKLSFSLLPEFLLISGLVVLYFYRYEAGGWFFPLTALAAGTYAIVRFFLSILTRARFYSRMQDVLSTINEFKKGKFSTASNSGQTGKGPFSSLMSELSVMGKHLENILSTQKTEISNLRELYHNIVLSISSFFIALDEKEEIIFANESFCKKFQYELEDIVGKKIDTIFIFLTSTIRESIKRVLQGHEAVVLEKTHLVSANKISIIADIKLTTMVVKGRTQVIFVIDDVTAICKKDFQINLISQVSESIQRDDEIDSVLHAILIGVTSGSGLGFNRAMLFLANPRDKALKGKMAVGPDTMEEAIKIWSSVSECGVDIYSQLKSYNENKEGGGKLIEKVQTSSFSLKDEANIFVRALNSQEHIHVYDAYNDERVSEEIRGFMEVREFVVTPLVSVNKSLGVIVADNRFNQTPIGYDNIELLSIFAFQAALLIESYNNLHMIKKEMGKIRDRQEAMVESEKLAAVGRIASHIAHEIRNPLVTMGGYARRIVQLARDVPKTGESIAKAATVVLKESERLEKTLSNVMDFSRASHFIMEFNNINEVISDTYELLKNLFQERRLKVDLKLDDGIPLVKSDFNQMKQVMLNLFQNAIDATPPEGTVTVATGANGDRITVSVKDSGLGMADDDIHRIFEPFYSTKVTGVGLGLSIVKKIITDHNGEVSVTSKKDGGSEFLINLPIPK